MANSIVASATYTIQQQVAPPALSPVGGTYTSSVTVTISDGTAGATIYYTTDGSTPTTASTPYSSPITLSQSATVKAMAAASGMANSIVASATYTIQQQVATPALSPAGGTYTSSVTVTISDGTAGATIYYTTDGSTPTTASKPYSSSITLTQSATVKAMAVASGMTNSGVVSSTYTIQVPAPALSPVGGVYTSSVTVTMTDSTAGATIYYTTDGSTPTTASTPYSSPITVSQTATIKAMATASGMANSSVASATYTIQAATPALSPPGGTYISSVTVSMTDGTSGATIYYTTDGSTPTTASTPYSGPITLTQSATVKAVAAASGISNSNVASATYTIQQRVAAPALSPGSGTYISSVTVTIADGTAGATIYYTTDGSTPTTASTPYSSPITLTQTATVKAMAAASGMANSNVSSATYTVQQHVATPALGPGSGTYTSSVTVTISDSTAGATIYYTTDGSTPTTASSVYSGALSVTRSMTVKAMAAAAGMANSNVASATYTVQTAAPTFNPPSGSYILALTVSISDATPGATIYYTTDGSTPTTSSARYSGPILLNILGTTTVRAIAVAPGDSQSQVSTATYNVLL
jgi:hypothetical protein